MALAGMAYGGVVLTTFCILICVCSDGFVPRQDGLAGRPTMGTRHYYFFQGVPWWVLAMTV